MDNIYLRKYQTLALYEWLKTTGQQDSSSDACVTQVITYFACIGKQASEANIIKLLKWSGIDFERGTDQKSVKRLFSYYNGAGIIEVIDNNLRLKENFENIDAKPFKDGQKADISALINVAHEVSNKISILLNHYEVGFDA